MKLCHYIGIYAIASDDINVQKLSMDLKQEVEKYFVDPCIVLETNESYWKVPESRCIVYSILNDQKIRIADIMNLFSVSWEYSEGYVFNVEVQQRVDTEEAIWSQLCHPEEQLLASEIRWVHVYTWEKKKVL